MRKLLLILALFSPALLPAQTPARFDLPVLTTTPATTPPGNQPPLYAVINAKVNVCGYPATMSGGVCTNKVTTYTDSTLSTACPSTAQLTAPGTSACISTTGLQGALGFWYDSSAQTHMTYTISTSWGNFGPYDIDQSGGASLQVSTNSTPNASQSALNFSNTTPAAPSGAINVLWQNSGGNESGYVPAGAIPGAQCFLGLTGLVGAFTDGSGVIKEALCIGNGPVTFQVPSGATQLVLGVNDDKFADNTGSWSINVSVDGGTAVPVTVNGTMMPWNITTNPTWTYGINDGTTGIVAATGLTALDSVTLTYLSGTVWSGNAGYPATDANGSISKGTTGSGKGSTGTFFPTYYMSGSWSGGAITGLTGDGTATGPGVVPFTLATVNSAPGPCGDATHVCQITTDAKGRTTAQVAVPITASSGVSSINATTGAFTFTGPGVSCTGTTCTFSGGGGGGTVFCTPNAQTGTTYTLVLTDGTASGAACIGTVTMNNAATNTVTIPPNSSVAFPVPDEIDFIQLGAGQTTLVAGAGVTLITPTSLSTRAQNSTIGIRQLSTNTWIVFGDTQ